MHYVINATQSHFCTKSENIPNLSTYLPRTVYSLNRLRMYSQTRVLQGDWRPNHPQKSVTPKLSGKIK